MLSYLFSFEDLDAEDGGHLVNDAEDVMPLSEHGNAQDHQEEHVLVYRFSK